MRSRHPITEAERAAFEMLTRKERARVLDSRNRRLVDAWVNPSDRLPYVPARRVGRGSQGWEELLDSTIADGTAVTAAAATIVCPDFNVPAFYMLPGRTLRIYAAGTISTVITTPGTGVWGVSWGTAGAVVLAKTAAHNFLTTSVTTLAGWNITVYVTCRTAGATG